MDNKKPERIITLKDIWDIFTRKFWVMILAAILVMVLLYGYEMLTFVPRYTSTATLYILKQNTNGNTTNSDTTEDFSLALDVVNDCTYLLKSHAVLDQVSDMLSLDISYEQLSRSITTANPEKTRILEVTVEGDSPEQAKKVVDCLCEVGAKKIEEAMGFQQVNLFEYGTLNREPANMLGIKVYIMVAFFAAAFTFLAFVILRLLDDSLRTDDEIEKNLEVSIIGDIPNVNDSHKNQYGYYTYGGKSKKKSQLRGRRGDGK